MSRHPENPVGRHTYTTTCDSCKATRDVTRSSPARDQFQCVPAGWEIVFVEYKTLRQQYNTTNDEKRLWLKLCDRCKPKEGTPPEELAEEDRRWFTKLFRAGIFGITAAERKKA